MNQTPIDYSVLKDDDVALRAFCVNQINGGMGYINTELAEVLFEYIKNGPEKDEPTFQLVANKQSSDEASQKNN